MLSLVIGAAVLTKALVMSTLPAVMVQYAVDGGFGLGVVGRRWGRRLGRRSVAAGR